jgi:hypothetical protein
VISRIFNVDVKMINVKKLINKIANVEEKVAKVLLIIKKLLNLCNFTMVFHKLIINLTSRKMILMKIK